MVKERYKELINMEASQIAATKEQDDIVESAGLALLAAQEERSKVLETKEAALQASKERYEATFEACMKSDNLSRSRSAIEERLVATKTTETSQADDDSNVIMPVLKMAWRRLAEERAWEIYKAEVEKDRLQQEIAAKRAWERYLAEVETERLQQEITTKRAWERYLTEVESNILQEPFIRKVSTRVVLGQIPSTDGAQSQLNLDPHDEPILGKPQADLPSKELSAKRTKMDYK